MPCLPSSEFSYFDRWYKPFPNEWFMALFYHVLPTLPPFEHSPQAKLMVEDDLLQVGLEPNPRPRKTPNHKHNSSWKIWRFPKSWGYPKLSSSYCFWIFHDKQWRAIGVPPFSDKPTNNILLAIQPINCSHYITLYILPYYDYYGWFAFIVYIHDLGNLQMFLQL